MWYYTGTLHPYTWSHSSLLYVLPGIVYKYSFNYQSPVFGAFKIDHLIRSKAELTSIQRSGPSLQQHQKLTKLWEMNSLNDCSLFCKEHFLLKKGGVVLVNSLMDLKRPKGIHQALQNRLACTKEIIEPWLDQELNDDTIRILMKKSFFNYLKIWSFLTMMIDFSVLYLW